MTIFFTADQHFGHANAARLCHRPYDSVEEMDADLARRWNKVVSTGDTVYHLGDFTLSGTDAAIKYFSMLNGWVNILGNHWHHDRRWLGNSGFSRMPWLRTKTGPVTILPPMHVIETRNSGSLPAIVLCHYPLAEWDHKHYGAWHLHGHSHNNYVADGKILDVGVDSAAVWLDEYRPFSLEEVADIMRSKE